MRFRNPRSWAAITTLCSAVTLASSCSSDGGKKGGGTGGGASNSGGSGGGSIDADSGTGGAPGTGGTLPDGGDTDAMTGTGGTPDPGMCGNGSPDPGEDCDDGNDVSGDGCENDCTFTCTQTALGQQKCRDRQFCNGLETCSDEHICQPGTPQEDNAFCGVRHVCRDGACVVAPEICGDGLVIGAEQCDDQNDDPHDGCDECRYTCEGSVDCPLDDPCKVSASCTESNTCEYTVIPDYLTCPGGAPGRCIGGVCRTEYCSNGIVEESIEECDDGNRDPGDGCEPDCTWTCKNDADCEPDNDCFENPGCNLETHVCNPPILRPPDYVCGPNQLCSAGNCRPTECGDGVVDPAADPPEQCDDGNNIDGDGCDKDCTFSCVKKEDCTAPLPDCRAWDCVDHRCVSIPDGSSDACDNSAGPGTCNDGACTSGTCGNGTVEDGEQCDLGEGNGPNTGCEEDCTFSCTADTQCDNGEACDGVEVCELVPDQALGLKRCTTPDDLENGTPCDGMAGRICIDGVCRNSFCGDGFTDLAAGEECDPPDVPYCTQDCKAPEQCDLSGKWAMRIDANVSWPDDQFQIIPGGSGVIVQWILADFTQAGLAVSAQYKICGLIIPDFHVASDFNIDVGLTFSNALFDSGTIPLVPVNFTLGGLSPGSTFESDGVAVALIGVHMDSPLAQWESFTPADFLNGTNGVGHRDHDGDLEPGVTATTKSGGSYGDIPVGLGAPPITANRLDLVLRQIATQSGTVQSCSQLGGGANVLEVNYNVIGCITTGNAQCTPDQAALPAAVRPIFDAGTASFSAVKVPANATCADVRATAFP